MEWHSPFESVDFRSVATVLYVPLVQNSNSKRSWSAKYFPRWFNMWIQRWRLLVRKAKRIHRKKDQTSIDGSYRTKTRDPWTYLRPIDNDQINYRLVNGKRIPYWYKYHFHISINPEQSKNLKEKIRKFRSKTALGLLKCPKMAVTEKGHVNEYADNGYMPRCRILSFKLSRYAEPECGHVE